MNTVDPKVNAQTARTFRKAVIYYKKQQYKKALELFLQLANKNELDAQFNLGVMYFKGEGVLKNYKEAAKWYRKAAEQGCKLIKSKNKELRDVLKATKVSIKNK